VRLAIVGLGLVGTSVGLALKSLTQEIEIVGHDPEPSRLKRAKELGAIDKSHWNLPRSCEGADIILLDLPLDELEKTLRPLAEVVSEETLIIDTIPVKRPVLEIARRSLGGRGRFVGGHVVSPRLLGGAEPSSELLQGAVFFLVATEETPAQAIDTATTLAQAVGATPYYIGPEEHDGLVAAMCQLPWLVAMAVVRSLQVQPGWQDRSRIVGGEFAALGAILAEEEGGLEALWANVDNLRHWLKTCIQELQHLEGLLSQGEKAALEEVLAQTGEACREWLSPKDERPVGESVRSVWRSMFLGNWDRR